MTGNCNPWVTSDFSVNGKNERYRNSHCDFILPSYALEFNKNSNVEHLLKFYNIPDTIVFKYPIYSNSLKPDS